MAASCRTSPGCFGDHTYIMPYTDAIVGSQSGLYCHTDTVAVAAPPIVVSMFVFMSRSIRKTHRVGVGVFENTSSCIPVDFCLLLRATNDKMFCSEYLKDVLKLTALCSCLYWTHVEFWLSKTLFERILSLNLPHCLPTSTCMWTPITYAHQFLKRSIKDGRNYSMHMLSPRLSNATISKYSMQTPTQMPVLFRIPVPL